MCTLHDFMSLVIFLLLFTSVKQNRNTKITVGCIIVYNAFDFGMWSVLVVQSEQHVRAHPARSHCSHLLLKCRVATNISH